jgi:predicted transcriptional regulator
MKKEIIDGFSEIKVSNSRKKVLLALEDNVLIPSEISKVTSISPSHTSKALRELENIDLIVCLNPEKRVGRLYVLTKLGKEVLKCVKKYIEKK